MATRSNIGIEYEDGTVEFVYCHWDGYLSNNGEILFNYYTTREKVVNLLKHGDISSLDKSPASCTFYHRDKGEELEELLPRMVKDKEKAFQQSYAYIFNVVEDAWYCAFYDSDGWVLLADALAEDEG